MRYDGIYDAIVIGAGHAGVEACLALARTGHKTLVVTLSLDAIAFMACNPAIGGTAKGHLVREIDALGGQMGLAADANALQIRMLNTGKGAAVRSLRGQEDKASYHGYMKRVLEREPDLDILQSEVSRILTDGDGVCGIETMQGQRYACRGIVVATGVYLNAEIIIGDFRQQVGPNGFCRATALTSSLLSLGIDPTFQDGHSRENRRQDRGFFQNADPERRRKDISVLLYDRRLSAQQTTLLSHLHDRANERDNFVQSGQIASFQRLYKERGTPLLSVHRGQSRKIFGQRASSDIHRTRKRGHGRTVRTGHEQALCRWTYR